jgi:hypothetical protein
MKIFSSQRRSANRYKIVAVCLTIATISLLLWNNPLRRSPEYLRAYVLELTPLGSEFEHVLCVIDDNGWVARFVNESSGFVHQEIRPLTVIGEKSIRASLGDYQDIPFEANVTVFWGFDAEGKLLDIWVWKTWNGL